MSKVSEWVQKAVYNIMSLEGDKKSIDTRKEQDLLANILAGCENEPDKNFVQGFMIEHTVMPEVDQTVPADGTDNQNYRVSRVYNDDGSFYDVLTSRGPNNEQARMYLEFDENEILKRAVTTLLENGVERKAGVIEYDSHGQEIMHIEYSKEGVPTIIEEKESQMTSKPQTSDASEKINASIDSNNKSSDGYLTPEEIKEARDIGVKVAERLLGATTKKEEEIIRLNMEKITADNVLEFLRGYEETRGGGEIRTPNTMGFGLQQLLEQAWNPKRGDAFFEQLRTEWNPEKQNLMKNVITALKDFSAARYGKDFPLTKEFEVILLEDKFGAEEAKKLDKFVAQLLIENMN